MQGTATLLFILGVKREQFGRELTREKRKEKQLIPTGKGGQFSVQHFERKIRMIEYSAWIKL